METTQAESWTYLQNKGVNHNSPTDPTCSFFLDKKGKKKIARTLSMEYVGGRRHIFWRGWYTRADKVAELVLRLKTLAIGYSAFVVQPMLRKALGRKVSREVYYLDKEHCLNYIDIHRGTEKENDISASGYNRVRPLSGGHGSLCLHDIVQIPGWDTRFRGWEDGFQEGQKILRTLSTLNSKWTRFYRVKEILNFIIHSKLKVIVDDIPVGAVIDINVGPSKFRFERLSTYAKDGPWQEISSAPVREVDISNIIPKYP